MRRGRGMSAGGGGSPPGFTLSPLVLFLGLRRQAAHPYSEHALTADDLRLDVIQSFFACTVPEAGEQQWKYVCQFVSSVLTTKEKPIDVVKAALTKLSCGILSAEKATPESFTKKLLDDLSKFEVLIDLQPPTLNQEMRGALGRSLEDTNIEGTLAHMLNAFPAQGKPLLDAAKERRNHNNELVLWREKLDAVLKGLHQLPHDQLFAIDQVKDLTVMLNGAKPPTGDYWKYLPDDDRKQWADAKRHGVAAVLSVGVGCFLHVLNDWFNKVETDVDKVMSDLAHAFKDRG